MNPLELAEQHQVLLLEPRETFDRALVGVTDKPRDWWPRRTNTFVAVYSIPLCIEAMVQDNEGWTHDDAVEFFEFNTAQAWVGEGTPTFIDKKRMNKRSSDMKVEIVGNNLVITIALQEPTPSASGKTLVVATSSGNKETDVKINGKNVTVGFNAYIKR